MKKVLLIAGVLVLVFFVGVGVGSAGTEAETVTETVIEEVEVPGPTETITETVTEEVEVEVTPEVCLDALDSAEQLAGDASVFGDIMVRFSTVSRQAVLAAFQQSASGLEQATDDIAAVNDRIRLLTVATTGHVSTYRSDAQDCRAS